MRAQAIWDKSEQGHVVPTTLKASKTFSQAPELAADYPESYKTTESSIVS